MKGTKIWLIISSILMLSGLSLAAIGTARGGKWNMKFNLSDFKITTGADDFVTDTLKQDPFSTIIVKTSTFDVNIIKGSDYSVTYHVPEDKVPQITNSNGILTVDAKQKEGFTIFDFTFLSKGDERAYIEITVPDADTKLAFDIESSTGDISATALTFDGSITTSTGDIKLSQNKMGNMRLEVSTGDIITENCSFTSLSTTGSTGEVKIQNSTCDGNYNAETSTGDITISNSEFKMFTVDGSTSDITVNNSTIDNVKVEVSTGDVEIDLIGDESEYSTMLHSSTGDIEINGDEFEKSYNRTNSGNKSISIDTSTGDITLKIRK